MIDKIGKPIATLCSFVVAAAMVAGCGKTQKDKPMLDTSAMTTLVNDLTDSLHAEIGVAFYDLETQQSYGCNDRQMMHAASTMKVPVMIEVFRQAETGKYTLDDSLVVVNSFKSIIDGSPFSLDVADDGSDSLYHQIDKKVCIRDLVEQMITWSSNLATNLLIELVDAKNVMATMKKLGADDIQVLRGVEDIKAYQQGRNNRTDARDLMILLRSIEKRQAASPASCDEMISILKRQHWRSKIPAGVPDDVEVANKTGSITAIDHDCAIVYPHHRKPYILVVLTKGIASQKASEAAIATISQRVYANLAVPSQEQ